MFKRTLSTFTLMLFMATMTNIALVSSAAAERYYDYATRTWVNYDPKKRMNRGKILPKKFKKQNVRIKTHATPGSIIIDTDKKFLFYITGKNKAIRYGIGVGREGFGWHGAVIIRDKKEWPVWTPPAAMRARERAKGVILPVTMKGGPRNPLGARAMYLYKGNRDTLYRIHGTIQPWTIGHNVSSGCIRMINKDVVDLYDKVKIGARVMVIGPSQNSAKVYTPMKNSIFALFDN